MINERIGQVVSSRSWVVNCASNVNRFRKALSPEEAELFNECLLRICRDPHIDGIHKFMLPIGFPLVKLMYRDDNFVLIYYPTQVNSPVLTRKIEVFKAARTRDFDAESATLGH